MRVIQAGTTVPQIRPTSQPMPLLQPIEARLLVKLTEYDDEDVSVVLHVDGKLYILPFGQASVSFALIDDAIEGVHFEFAS